VTERFTKHFTMTFRPSDYDRMVAAAESKGGIQPGSLVRMAVSEFLEREAKRSMVDAERVS
jgi:hypothetical protein